MASYGVFSDGTSSKVPACQCRGYETQIWSLGWRDPLEEGMAFQYSCLENPIDRGACWATVPRVTKSQAWVVTEQQHSVYYSHKLPGNLEWCNLLFIALTKHVHGISLTPLRSVVSKYLSTGSYKNKLPLLFYGICLKARVSNPWSFSSFKDTWDLKTDISSLISLIETAFLF